MSVTLTYMRLFADDADVSRFAPLEIEVSPRDFALRLLPSAYLR